MGTLLHFSTAIKKAADKKEAQIQIYFHKTKQELEELLNMVESFIKTYARYQKIASSGFVNNKPVRETLSSMNEWPERMEFQLNIIHQTLGEEFALVAEDFPDDLLGHIQEINDRIKGLSRSTFGGSVSALQENILELQKEPVDKSTLDIINKTLHSLQEQIKIVLNKCSLEEALEKKEHHLVQQLLGNKYLETHTETFQKWWETTIAEHFQETYRKKKMEELPSFSVDASVEKKEINLSVYGKITIPLVVLNIKIRIDTPTPAIVELSAYYNCEKDKFHGEIYLQHGRERREYPPHTYADISAFFEDIYQGWITRL